MIRQIANLGFLSIAIALLYSSHAFAQAAGKDKPAAAAPAAPAAPAPAAKGPATKAKPGDAKEEDPLAMKSFEVSTTDRVRIKFDFYPGAAGKESVPVVLLHGFKGSRADFKALAPKIQTEGHAVIVPDLRGHGESVMRGQVDPRTKAEKVVKDTKLSPERLSPTELGNMARYDMNAIGKWIQERNNKNELNARKLCIVGADIGGLVGITWASKIDWGWENYGPFAQGKDTQALVLLSPPTQYKNLKSDDLFARPALCAAASVMILVGNKEQPDLKAAKLLHGKLTRYHKAPPKANGAVEADEEKAPAKKPAATPAKAGAGAKKPPAEIPSLVLKEVNTTFQGVKLLGNPKLDVKVDQEIIDFLAARVGDKEIEWVEHKPPL